MKYKYSSRILMIMIFMLMLLFADLYIWGDASGRINPAKIASGKMDVGYDKIVEYFLVAVVAMFGLDYLRLKKNR